MTRKRIAALYLAFVGVLLVGTWFVLRETGVAHTFVEGLLAKVFVRERFSLAGANVDIGGGTVTLEGFELRSRDPERGARLAARQVQLSVETNPLGAVGAVRGVRVRGMELEIDLTRGDLPDLSDLLAGPTERDPAARREPPPPVEVRDSTIALRLDPGEAPVLFRDVQLALVPEEPGSSRMVLSGSMKSPNGYEVTVGGGGDLSKPEFRALLEMVDISLRPEIAGPYNRQVVDYLAEIGVDGTAKRLAVWAEYRGEPGPEEQELVAGVRLDLSDVSCVVPELPYPLVDASAHISATSRDNGTVEFEVRDQSVHYEVVASGRLREVFSGEPVVDVQADASGVLVDPVLGRALGAIRDTRSAWEAFEPSGGRADAKIHLWNDSAGEPLAAEIDLVLDGVGARFVGFTGSDGSKSPSFPVPLRDVSGRVRVRRGDLLVDGITARLGGGEIAMSGTIRTRRGADPTIDLDLTSRDLEFRDDIRDALAGIDPDLPGVWDEYAPRGHAALDVSLRFGPEVAEEGAIVEIRPLAASAAWVECPYRVEDLRGLVRIAPDEVRVDLEGDRGDARVVLDGTFEVREDGEEGSTQMWLRANGLTTDADLYSSLRRLEPSISDACEYLGLHGRADVELALWRDRGESDFAYDVRVDIASGTAQLEDLRIPLQELSGPLYIHGRGADCRVDIGGIRGKVDNGPDRPLADLLVHGSVDARASDYAMDVTSVVHGLELTDVLAEALDHNGAFGLETWTKLRPSGRVDTITRRTKSPGEDEARTEIWLQLDGVGSAAEFLPDRAEELYGAVTVVDGVASFSDIRGTMGGAEVHCARGTVRQADGATVFDATVSSDRFPVDDRLGHLMSGPLRETYLAREVRGWMRVDELNLALRVPDDGSAMTTRFDGRFAALDVRLELGTEVEEVRGRVTMDVGSRIDGDGGTVLGGVERGSFRIQGHTVTGIDARYHADPERFVLETVNGRLHGGSVRGIADAGPALVYRYEGEGRLSFDLEWESVSLSQMLNASGVTQPDWRGNLDGWFHLEELDGARFIDMAGNGSLSIREADLGSVPMFTAIYSYLGPKRRPRFDGMSLSLTVDDRMVGIHELELRSPLLTVTGRGTVDMGGYVDMTIDFPDLIGRAADWMVLPYVLRTITSSVVQFQIYGHRRAPKARPLWLWQDKADRLPLSPLPAADPGPER